jgi:hypothetical protein
MGHIRTSTNRTKNGRARRDLYDIDRKPPLGLGIVSSKIETQGREKIRRHNKMGEKIVGLKKINNKMLKNNI